MKREIRFRVWNKATETMHCPGREELAVRAKLAEMELMQYTGLKDKNGKEGYHKDIAEEYDRKYIIEWIDERAQFALRPVGSSFALAMPMECLKEMAIIGNEPENPELLEQ